MVNGGSSSNTFEYSSRSSQQSGARRQVQPKENTARMHLPKRLMVEYDIVDISPIPLFSLDCVSDKAREEIWVNFEYLSKCGYSSVNDAV
eukprot:m.408576 g.408576  ORF g.408576 m.408576 type:complete len:90 (-) comp21237_c0_seq5:229-498(-)